MSESLKKEAGKAFGTNSRGQELDRIVSLPITQLRRELKNAYFEKKFTQEQFDDFTARIATLGGLDDQLDIAKRAATDREVTSEIDIELNTPSKTLLWAATLTRMMDESDEPVAKSRLWRQLCDSIGVHNESIIMAKVISASLQNDDVTFAYGQPGTWFYHHRIDNHINMDLYFMLLTGFEHIRSVGLHEIGHSELSVNFTGKMKEIYDKVKQYIDPRTIDAPSGLPEKEFTIEEQKEIAKDVREWELRHSLWHPTEDNCVNQFGANMEDVIKIGQNFGDSLNHISVMLQNFWSLEPDRLPESLTTEIPKPQTPEEKEIYEAIEADRAEKIARHRRMIEAFNKPLPQSEIDAMEKGDISPVAARKMFRQITSMSLMAFYEKNGLFKGDKETWERFKVFPDDINKTIDVSKIPAAKGKTAFQYLYDLCGGKNGVHAQQPKPSDRFFGEVRYRKKVVETCEARAKIVDHIWDVYLEKFAEVLKEEYAKKIEDQLKQQQNGNQKPGQQGQQGQSGQGQSGQGQSGQGNQSGEGQGGGSQDSSGDGNASPSSNDNQSGGQQGKESQKQGGQKQGDDKNGGQEKEGGDDVGQGKGKGKNDKDAGKDGNPDKNDDGNKGGGKKALNKDLKKAVGGMSETPEEARNKENGVKADGKNKKDANKDAKKDKGGWGQDPTQETPRQKVGDIKKEKPINDNLTEEQKAEMREAAKNKDPSKSDNMRSNAAGSQGMELDLKNLAKGNWNDFQARVTELMPVITRLAETYRQIKEEQRQEIIRLSPEHELLPEDGDFRGRLDRGKYLDMKFRQATGQPISIEDLKKFTADRVTTMESTIEIASLIDGSGSMQGWRINAAIQSAVINYMAARMAGIDSYIIVWGDPVPKVIATPISDFKKVGAMLEELRQRANGGTQLHYALDSIVDTMSKHQNGPETISGSSHVIVYSDGDIFDQQQVATRLKAVCGSGRNISIDVAILRENANPDIPTGTQMEKVFQEQINESGNRHLGIARGTDPQEVPMEIARLILKRVRSFPVQTEPDAEKRRQLKQLHKRMSGPK